MRVLILGGTRFVGPPIVAAAVARGWAVTTFNRGLSGADLPGVQAVRGDRSVPADVTELAAHGPWDAVVDLAGYVPRETLALCRALEPVASRYVFMSTLSAYRGWPVEMLTEESPALDCQPDAGPDFGTDVADGPSRYGYQKAGCENAVLATFGPQRSTVLRAGVVLGPREYVGRLPWWLHRIAAGGTVLAPGEPGRTIQPVDVRDLADFTIGAVDGSLSGVFNVVAPTDRETFADLLTGCADVTGSAAEFVWVPDADLLRLGVGQWSELPLWRVHSAVWSVDSARAQQAGLTSRPLYDTVRDTWQWLAAGAEITGDPILAPIGIDRDKEQAVLRAVR